MLDRVSNIVLGLDGQGGAESFGDYLQWETWQAERKDAAQANARLGSRTTSATKTPVASKKKLSYLEAREYDKIEHRVAEAEHVLEAKRTQLEDPAIASDGPRLVGAHAELEAAQDKVDTLYARWAELEKKKN
jgi:ATP-binding cassette subfamily F protein uup